MTVVSISTSPAPGSYTGEDVVEINCHGGPAVLRAVHDAVAKGEPSITAALTVTGRIAERPFTLTGVAKGAGMIRPDMATMLCYVCTDVAADAKMLQDLLTDAVNLSFNRITIDGDTSTNDTVILLANGASGARIASNPDKKRFQHLLDDLCMDLARQMVRDGEGVTKLVVDESVIEGEAEPLMLYENQPQQASASD